MQQSNRIFRTPLGDTVNTIIDERGEHVTIETRPHGTPLALAPELELAPDRSGLYAYERYNR